MESKQLKKPSHANQAHPGATGVLWQVAELVKSVYKCNVEVSTCGSSFHTSPTVDNRDGIHSVTAILQDDPVINVKLEWLKTSARSGPSIEAFWKHLSGLGEGVCPLPPVTDQQSNSTSYWLELKVQATAPLGASRQAVLANKLEAIDNFSRSVRGDLCQSQSPSELEKLYAEYEKVLSPVWPLDTTGQKYPDELIEWSQHTTEFLDSSLNIAISAEFEIHRGFALAALAHTAIGNGRTLGKIKAPIFGAANIIDMAQKAPGTIIVPVDRIALGSNRYEMGDEVKGLLTILSSSQTPAVFVGRFSELQQVFHGGQGGNCDPLSPVVSHAPEVPTEMLVSYAIEHAIRGGQAIPTSELKDTHLTICDSLSQLPEADQLRLLPAVVAREIANRTKHSSNATSTTTSFVSRVASLTETLAGLHYRQKATRLPKVQQNYTEKLLSPDILDTFTDELFAQDRALTQLVERLQTEHLTRPDSQPIRYRAQGTPGTGKSQSAAILARILNVPHINIDASSQPDYHTASAQLLGSGRGIVGSHESGRLEKAAKHDQGAVVEVSDLDHAPLSVRSHMADLFLQILDTGDAQSATGATFSCANLIFAFTINLPEGNDERIYRGIGFDTEKSEREIHARVKSELKKMFSNAFLSRIGQPILFAPLTGKDLALIAEQEVKRAVRQAVSTFGVDNGGIKLAKELGERIIASLSPDLLSHGARMVAEHARLLVTKALLPYKGDPKSLSGCTLSIKHAKNSKLVISRRK